MLPAGDYMPLYEVRQRFTLRGDLASQLSERVDARNKRRHLQSEQNRIAREKGRKFVCIPSEDDIVAHNYPNLAVDRVASEEAAFAKFTKASRLFAVGLTAAADAVEVNAGVLDTDYEHLDRGARKVWVYVEPTYYTVNVQTGLEIVDLAKRVLRSLIPLTAIDTRRFQVIVEREPLLRTLVPLQDHFICIRRADLPKENEMAFWFNLEEPALDTARETDLVAQKGRPRKQEAAVAAFQSRFPKGRGGYSWKAVLEILQEEEGVVVSGDTLKNGLKAAGII